MIEGGSILLLKIVNGGLVNVPMTAPDPLGGNVQKDFFYEYYSHVGDPVYGHPRAANFGTARTWTFPAGT